MAKTAVFETPGKRGVSGLEQWIFPPTSLMPDAVSLQIGIRLDPHKQTMSLRSAQNPALHLDCRIRQENHAVVVTLNRLEVVEPLRGKGLGKRVVRKIVEAYAKYLNPDFGKRVTDVLFVETNLEGFCAVAFFNRIKHQSEKIVTFGPCRSRVALRALPKT